MTVLELALVLGGSIYFWGKVGSVILGLGLVSYGCYKLLEFLKRIRILRSALECR